MDVASVWDIVVLHYAHAKRKMQSQLQKNADSISGDSDLFVFCRAIFGVDEFEHCLKEMQSKISPLIGPLFTH
jgi:hypothetical protein